MVTVKVTLYSSHDTEGASMFTPTEYKEIWEVLLPFFHFPTLQAITAEFPAFTVEFLDFSDKCLYGGV